MQMQQMALIIALLAVGMIVLELIKLRRSSDALGSDGDWRLVSSLDAPYPMIYERTSGDEVWVVALNPTAKKVTGEIPTYSADPEPVFGSYDSVKYRSGKEVDKITLSPVSAAVFKVR